MRNIPEFKIDKFVQRHAPLAKIPLHGSNIGALSLSDLQQFAPDQQILDPELPLSYGPAQGSPRLRERIAAMYSSPETGVTLTADNVIVTPGSIMANYLALVTLAGPGDHVICQYPTFSQLFSIPRFQGAEVSLWRLRPGPAGWECNLDELEGLVKPNTKAIIINNPNNPTGAILPLSTLQSLAALAKAHSLTLYSDEVFRPLFHDSAAPPPSLLALNHVRTVVTGSVSKTIGLPGIRVGWIVSNDVSFLQEHVMTARDYTTIAVSQLDDAVASFALESSVLPKIMVRNLETCRRSIRVIGEWVARNGDRVEWVPPLAAGTAFVRVRGNDDGGWVDDGVFVSELVKTRGVSVVPGGFAFGEPDGKDEELKGYVRISLGLGEGVLKEGLAGLEDFLRGYK